MSIHPDAFLKGYGKSRTNALPVYTAEQVMQMRPDDLALPFRFTTQQERDFYEYTPQGQSKLMAPHVNASDATPRHRRYWQRPRNQPKATI